MPKYIDWPRGVYRITKEDEPTYKIKILDGKDVYSIALDWYRSRILVSKADSPYDKERYKKSEARMLTLEEDVNWGFARQQYNSSTIAFTEPTDKYITRMSAAIKLLFDYDMVEPRLLFDNTMGAAENPFYLVDNNKQVFHLKKGTGRKSGYREGLNYIQYIEEDNAARELSRPVWPFENVYLDSIGDGLVPYSRLKADIFDAMKDIDDPFAFKNGVADIKMALPISPITRESKKKRGKK